MLLPLQVVNVPPGGGAFSFFFALSVAIINKYCKQYASKKGKRADGGGGCSSRRLGRLWLSLAALVG